MTYFFIKLIFLIKQFDISPVDLLSLEKIFGFLGNLLIFKDDQGRSSSFPVRFFDEDVLFSKWITLEEFLNYIEFNFEWKTLENQRSIFVVSIGMIGKDHLLQIGVSENIDSFWYHELLVLSEGNDIKIDIPTSDVLLVQSLLGILSSFLIVEQNRSPTIFSSVITNLELDRILNGFET